MSLLAIPPEVSQVMLEEMFAALNHEIPDPGPDDYNTKRENQKRELMQTLAFYAEEGPTWDPEGKYLCGSCYYRQLMDWGDTPACYTVEGKISMEAGSCQFYRYGNPDSEWNPLPMKKKYTQEEANYAERPKVKGFGCFPRCEYGKVAEGKDRDGREIWCGQFGVHVRPKACCAFEDGSDLVQIEAGGPGSGCNPEVGKCGRPEGPHAVDYMTEKVGEKKGTNPGGMYKGSDGVTRYVKWYTDDRQARGEALANKIYNDLGLGAQKSVLFTKADGKHAIASEMVAPNGKTLAQYGITKEIANKILDGFAADVLTANWDAVGQGHDNIIVGPQGMVYRIDQGGTFLKRAQGGDKPEGLLNQITEVNKLFDKSTNSSYAKVGDAAGIKSVADMTDRFRTQVNEISFLAEKVGGWQKYVEQNAPLMPKAEQKQIAGMLESRTNLLVTKMYEQSTPAVKQTTHVVEEKKPEDQPVAKSWKGRDWSSPPNSNLVGGYFRQGTVVAQVYQKLASKEGEWQKVSEIKKEIEDKIGRTLYNISQNTLKQGGAKTGLWQLEISKDDVRIFLKKAGDVKPVELTENKQSLAANLAKAVIEKQKVGSFVEPSMFGNYYKQMGVSADSRSSMENAIREWTGSIDDPAAQAWRQVAMNYYNRKPDDEHIEGYHKKVIGEQWAAKKAKDMQDGVMAMKALASEYARQHDVNVVYRGIGGDVAGKIASALLAGSTKVAIPINSLSSWSSSPVRASKFGSVMLRMKIDPDNVWAVHKATPGLFSAHSIESEYVVGMHNAQEVFSLDDIKITNPMKHSLNEEQKKKFSEKMFAKKAKEKKPFVIDGHLDENWLHKKEK